LDGERKRQRNVDARLDPAQGGTGELLGAYNRHWSAAARGNSHGTNPLLSTAAQGDRRFRPFDSRGHGNVNGNGNEPETRSLDGFSVGLSDGGGSGASGSRHTRRTEALYLEASLRAARKDAMRAAYNDQGFTFQPNFKDAATTKKTKTWNPFSTRSLANVVQRLYNPAAAGEKKAGNAAKAAAFELRHFVGTLDIKKLATKVTRVRVM
jgi:hypothetical protein